MASAYIAAGRQAEATGSGRALLDEYPQLSVPAVMDAMVMPRPGMLRIADRLARSGLPTRG